MAEVAYVYVGSNTAASSDSTKFAFRSFKRTDGRTRKRALARRVTARAPTSEAVRQPIRTAELKVPLVSHADHDQIEVLMLSTSLPLIDTERGRALSEALHALREQTTQQDWDGYGASPVEPQAYELAQRVAALLPNNVVVPEVATDPDGEVSFEWYRGPRQVLTISVGANRRISYAGLFGANKVHGVEYLQDELPEPVLTSLRRLFGRDK